VNGGDVLQGSFCIVLSRTQLLFVIVTAKRIGPRGSTYWERRTAILEPGRGQLHAEPHVRPISCHVASLSWQEPEEELNKLLLMKSLIRDRNVKVKMLVVLKYLVFLQ